MQIIILEFGGVLPYLRRGILLFILLDIYILHACAGYIINESGQLVPYKLYKKGGYKMCFLHPMNCRGGFHKRRFDETSSQKSDNIYGLRDNIKGQMARHKDLTHGEKYNTEAILRELYGSLNAEQFKTDPDPRRSYRNTNDARNSISVSSKRSTSLKDDLNEEQFDTYDFINNEKRSDDDYPFDLGYVPTALADPPPLDRSKNIKATHDKYSDYDLLDVFDDFSDRDSLELLRIFPDSGKMRILEYIKRRRR